ncbi:MAG: globin domain-containing protein [Nannocystaceae bacterium]|nr:globin domain-containing protein [bacterium]
MSNAQLLQSNLELVVSRDPDLMQIFYTTLFERYPSVQPLFGRNSRDEQAKMLTEAVAMLVSKVDDPQFVETTMLAVGRKHVDYGVEDHMYAWVGECLVATLAQVSGEDWNDALEDGWTATLEAISAIAIQGAAAERAERATQPATS